ncbi:MAG: MmgE/PrpD family protein, partial [Bradyrhizobium sp.]|nr:MmgE/PrpD family protein [Bradyrhizobium sp.]
SAIRARREAESTPSVVKMLAALKLDSAGEATVFGDSRTWTPAVAALLNGTMGHSLDFDDTHADSSLHPSAPVVPAAFAVGEMVGASGREVLTAIVAGYEVCCRLGNALDPTSHYARGFHPTATAGTYGAAAAAGKLFGLSEQQLIYAFGVSGSQAAGSLQFLVNGAWNKRYQVGASAMNGVIAATLAKNDFVGAIESVEGKHGLLVAYTDTPHREKAVAGLGTTYETMKIGVKPYPSCRYTHAAIDAIIALRREHNLTPDQVKRVEIGLHRNGITLTGDAATKRHPTSIVGGQFSMFFTGALALDQGRFGWDDYTRLGDAAINNLANKFDVVQDDKLEIGRSHPFGARVTITTEDGVHERLHDDPSGEPTSFPSAQAMSDKFITLARPVLSSRAQHFADAILGLERFDRVAQATALGRA